MTTQQPVYHLIPVAKLFESPHNLRKHYDENKLAELSANIKLNGVKAPILCRPIRKGKPWLEDIGDILTADKFEIAAGHRRGRASKLAGLEFVPAVIQPMTDEAFLEVILVENLQRADVHPLDEAVGYQELLKRPGYDAAFIAGKVGRDVGYVQKRLCLLRLTPEAKAKFWANEINIAVALILAPLGADDQKAALKRMFGKNDLARIRTSAQLHEWVEKELMMDLANAMFDKEDHDLVPAAGACSACPKRTGFQPALFSGCKIDDACTDRVCFAGKKAAHVKFQIVQLTAGNAGVAPILVSTSYEHMPGTSNGAPVIGNGRWIEVKKKKKEQCDSMKLALVVRGAERVGQSLNICTDPACTVHGRNRHRIEQTPAELAIQKKREYATKVDGLTRQAILDRTAAAFDPKKVTAADLRMVATLAFQRWGNSESRRAMSLARTGQEETHIDHKNAISDWLEDAKADDLLRLIFEAALQEHLYYFEHGGSEDVLVRLAERWKVDVKTLRAEVSAGLRTKQKAAAHRAKQRDIAKAAKAARAVAKAKKAEPAVAKGKGKKASPAPAVTSTVAA